MTDNRAQPVQPGCIVKIHGLTTNSSYNGALADAVECED